MLFNWKKTKSPNARRAKPMAFEPNFLENLGITQAAGARSQEAQILFQQVSLGPSIRNVSLSIPAGAWLLLVGPNDFSKALFCDLCFGYIQPEQGKIHPMLRGSDVGFLGRSNTTYGKTLLDHLSAGVRERSKELFTFVARAVFTKSLKQHLETGSPLVLKENKRMEETELLERDYLEIAEANLLLQKKQAVIIDTTSDFYQIALEQGFRHSELLLNSGKTIFWILNEEKTGSLDQSPWRDPQYKNPAMGPITLYFDHESLVSHIN